MYTTPTVLMKRVCEHSSGLSMSLWLCALVMREYFAVSNGFLVIIKDQSKFNKCGNNTRSRQVSYALGYKFLIEIPLFSKK